MIYLDTNIFVIAVLEGGKAKEILNKLADKKTQAFTSIITWDEFVWSIKKATLDYEFAKKEGKRFLFLPNIKFVDVSFDIVKKAKELIENYNLNPRDAIHIATAIVKGVREIISDDPDLDKAKEIKRVSISNF